MNAAMQCRVYEIADAAGRLRAIIDDGRGGYLLDRIVSAVWALDLALQPSAAETYRANVHAGMTEDEALADALADADRQSRRLRALLREVKR